MYTYCIFIHTSYFYLQKYVYNTVCIYIIYIYVHAGRERERDLVQPLGSILNTLVKTRTSSHQVPVVSSSRGPSRPCEIMISVTQKIWPCFGPKLTPKKSGDLVQGSILDQTSFENGKKHSCPVDSPWCFRHTSNPHAEVSVRSTLMEQKGTAARVDWPNSCGRSQKPGRLKVLAECSNASQQYHHHEILISTIFKSGKIWYLQQNPQDAKSSKSEIKNFEPGQVGWKSGRISPTTWEPIK